VKLMRYIGGQLLFSTSITVAAMVLPIVLTIVVGHVPFRALMIGFWWPALVGSLPSTAFMILPVAVSVALVWTYGALATDGIVAVLYSSRLSPFGLLKPAMPFILFYTLAGYGLGMIVAPATSSFLHDTIFTVKNNIDPRLLEEGKFYEVPDGTSALSFDRWVGTWEVEKMFVRERRPDGTERLISSDRAEFVKSGDSLFVILKKGRVHSMRPGAKNATSVDFEQIAQPLGVGGTNTVKKRDWRGVYEMPMAEFLTAQSNPQMSEWDRRLFASEAVKRFVLPAMCLSHALLALGLLLSFGPLTGRRGLKPSVIALLCVGLHAGGIGLAEALSSATFYSPGLMGMVVTLEGMVGLGLLLRQQFGWTMLKRQPSFRPATA
jgi:lipopolysaccharide export system permease protein